MARADVPAVKMQRPQLASLKSEDHPTSSMSNLPKTRPARQASGQGLPPTGSSASSANGVEPAHHSQSFQQKLAGRANSGAANALAAAAAAGGADRDMQAAASSGRRLSKDADLVYDVAVRLPGEAQTQLEVNPITIVASDPFFEMRQRIAVNEHFICYSLKTCQIRALHKSTGRRALIKGASAPPDIRFASNTVSRLASADMGSVTIWDIDMKERSDDKLTEQFVFKIDSDTADGSNMAKRPPFMWHPNQTAAQILAIGDNGRILFADVPAAASAAETGLAGCNASASQLPTGMAYVQCNGLVTALAFSADGGKLAAVSGQNKVSVWSLPNNGRSLSDYELLNTLVTFEPYGQQQCSTVLWLTATVLATGDADNSFIKLWYVTHTAELLQSITFTNTEGSHDPTFFNHMDAQADTGLLVLANSRRPALYTLHFEGSDASLRFDYLADFSVSQPIMSFTMQYDSAESPPALHLYCTQPMAIQNYTLNPALCRPSAPPDSSPALPDEPPSTAPESQPPHSGPMTFAHLLQRNGAKVVSSPSGQHSRSGGSSQLQQPGTRMTPQPQSPAGGTKQPRKVMTYAELMVAVNEKDRQSTPHVSSPSGQQSPSGSSQLQQPGTRMAPQPQSPAGGTKQPRKSPMTYAELIMAAVEKDRQSVPPVSSPSGQHSPSGSSHQQPPPIRTTPQPPSPAGPPEQPRLLTPTHLMKQATRSASQSSMASLLSQHTPPSTARSLADNTDAVSTATTQGSSKRQDGLDSRQLSAETIPSPAAALDASTSAQYDSPTASAPDSRANTPPPSTPALPPAAYLTPEQYHPERRPSPAQQSTSSQPDLRLDLVHRPGTSDQVNVKLLQRDNVGSAEAGPSQQAPAPPPATPSAVFSQPLDLLPVSNAAPSPLPHAASGAAGQQGQASAPVTSSHGSLGRSTELSDGAVRSIADAVAERTLAQHKQLLSYLNDRHRELLRTIKGDIREEGKQLQLAFDAQVTKMMKSQGSMVAEDRRVLMAEQNNSMERLVNSISATVNRDLPLRMEEIVRAEVASITTEVQQQVGSAVQAALAEALPRQLAGPHLKAALEASLGSQLQQALARPLQTSFTMAFQHQLMPAFEGACRDMFAQVQATFAGGLQEHLQAAGGANAATAASLRESLGTSAQILSDLKSQKSSQKNSGAVSLADLEAQQDPTLELSHLIRTHRYEEAFHKVLGLEDVGMVSWLCQQLDPGSVLSQSPPRLSQHLLLSLIQQLGHDLHKDTSTKLKWIQSTALALDPRDPSLALHMKPTLEQLYSNLQEVLSQSSNREAANQARMCQHLINSLIHSCII